jgi:4'-phosphopantetheinyl transferase
MPSPADTWSEPPDGLLLKQGEVHLWRINLRPENTQFLELERSLSLDELGRAERFHNPDSRMRFVAARGCLRLIIGRYLGQPPREVSIAYHHNGKPFLEGYPSRKIQFNLSHAHDLGLLAVCRNTAIGVDVEYMRSEREMKKIARRFFSPTELSEIEASPAPLQEEACYHFWTCKEALLKARGVGLSTGMNRVQISLGKGEPPRIIQDQEDEGVEERWSLSLIDPGPGYTGALAVEAKPIHLRHFHFSL